MAYQDNRGWHFHAEPVETVAWECGLLGQPTDLLVQIHDGPLWTLRERGSLRVIAWSQSRFPNVIDASERLRAVG